MYGAAVAVSSRYLPPGAYNVVLSHRTRCYRGGASGLKAKMVSFSLQYVYADTGAPAIKHTITLERTR
jgi:hypothetical protein